MDSGSPSINKGQPAFSYPIMKSRSGSSSHVKRTKDQKRSMIEEKKHLIGTTGTQRNNESLPEDDIHRSGHRSNPQSPTPPSEQSNSGTCPHCKIHSWLPHSAGCPNSQNNQKKSSSSLALYRK